MPSNFQYKRYKFLRLPSNREMESQLSRLENERILTNALTEMGINPDGVFLTKIDFLPAREAVGFLGEYYHLVMKYFVPSQPGEEFSDGNLKVLKLFVKVLPQQNNEKDKAVIFIKEANLYAALLKELQTYAETPWCPKCYFARNDLIAMEDLGELGYKISTTVSENMTESEVHQILRSLASMHASSVVYEDLRNINIGLRYQQMLQEITVAPQVAWYTTGMRAIIAVIRAHPSFQSDAMQKYLKEEVQKQLESVYDMVNTSIKYRNVFCHRDPWRGNVFFTKNVNNPDDPSNSKSTAIFVDFQTCRYCPAAVDLIYIMFMNLSTATRKSKEMEYLDFYHQQLEYKLKYFELTTDSSKMTKDSLIESYKEFQLFGCVYKAIAGTILKVPSSFITNDYKFVDRVEPVLNYMRKNKDFNNYMTDCVEEIMEVIFNEGKFPIELL